MIKRIGLTGGIGSGKSVVAQILEMYGVPVYDSDLRSKELCETNNALIDGLRQLFGEEVYSSDGRLNRSYMASLLFDNKELLETCNRLIHPVVANDFIKWSNLQDAPFVIQESAILFEAGLDHLFDEIICVCAPESLRLERVCERSGLSPEKVMARMRNQWTDQERIKRSQHVLQNDNITPLLPQIELLMKSLR